ncbi:RagB/SusD family nutrient uptake outer membrane protein [uncultured Bacteroides sp.]|uniref:RagB/SusD family nutrient uptake outer membrane protein n=1 Tax=uncultured Bacteroides sp. TaxID=162156 RepID=UPI002AAB534D|nr:RagB/SusD family nutrient uptake outer membrane protein [uncultured Bacteroides sp.]
MKNILVSILLAVALSVSLNSCSDFLDQPVLGQENLNTYFQNEEECLKQITGCYQSIYWDDWWQIAKFTMASDMCTDDMWIGNTTEDAGDYRDLAHYTGNGQTNATQNYWQYRYKGILRCNIAIEKIPGAPISNETLRKRLIAEAKFIRAFHYFELVKNFGGVPIVLKKLMPSEVKGIKRSSVAEVYQQIEKDLTEAIPDLPKRSEYAPVDMGRATKGAAQGYLGKVYLYQEKYADAEKMLFKVIESKEYKLLPNFGDVWSIATNNSEESLFEVQYNNDVTYNLGGRISILCGSRDDSGWAWGLPTSNLEKAFLDAGDTERLKWTIIKNGATEVPGDSTWSEKKPYIISPDKHKSARVTRKLYIPMGQRPTPYDAAHIPLNYRLLRYADVLLMYAEALNAQGTDRDAEARAALNEVRDRVHLPEVKSSGKELRDAIRLERRLELALEDNRLYDLRRWNDDNGKKEICNVMGENGSFVKYNLTESTDEYELTNQKEASNKGYNFREDRDQLFPIPHSEVTMSEGSIEQNPNY